jgi:hypothetical protein
MRSLGESYNLSDEDIYALIVPGMDRFEFLRAVEATTKK